MRRLPRLERNGLVAELQRRGEFLCLEHVRGAILQLLCLRARCGILIQCNGRQLCAGALLRYHFHVLHALCSPSH